MNTRDGEMIAEEDGWDEGDRWGSRKRRLSTFCPWHAYIRADTVRFIFSCSSSRTLCACTRAYGYICIHMCSLSFDFMFERSRSTQSGLITQTWRPLWLVLAYQILLLHMWYRISSWRQRPRICDGENRLGVG